MDNYVEEDKYKKEDQYVEEDNYVMDNYVMVILPLYESTSAPVS